MADLATRFEHFKAEHRRGYTHYCSFRTLSEGIENKPAVAEAVGQAVAFAANAHLETACGCLSRLLDRHSGSRFGQPLSFRSLLLTIRENSAAFSHTSARQLKHEVEADLHWCSPSNNSGISWLIDFRNNALAHYGALRIPEDESGRLFAALKYDEFNLDVIQTLFSELGTRIDKYQMWATHTSYTWEDWYISDGHNQMLDLIERGISQAL